VNIPAIKTVTILRSFIYGLSSLLRANLSDLSKI